MGALTSKPYAFTARPWELDRSPTVDFFDILGTPLRVDVRGSDIMRILPRVTNDFIAEEWISDKTRFFYDAVKNQRLAVPFTSFLSPPIRQSSLGEDSWSNIFEKLSLIFTSLGSFSTSEFYVGPFVDFDLCFLLKEFAFQFWGLFYYSVSFFPPVPHLPSSDWRFDFFSSSSIDRYLDGCDLLFFLGSNPRFDSPSLNVLFRRAALERNVPSYHLGSAQFFGESVSLGSSYESLLDLLEGRHPLVYQLLESKAPLLVFGDGFYFSSDAYRLVDIFRERFNFLLFYFSKARASLNFLESALPYYRTLPSLSVFGELGENLFLSKGPVCSFSFFAEEWSRSSSSFSCYLGTHGERQLSDERSSPFDFVLPSTLPFEKFGSTFNYAGVQLFSSPVVSPPLQSRVDWKIFNVFYYYLTGGSLMFSSLADLRSAQHCYHNSTYGRLVRPILKFFSSISVPTNSLFSFSYRDYFSSDYLSRSSYVLSLQRRRVSRRGNF